MAVCLSYVEYNSIKYTMWTCPKCKRSFRSTNQCHSCKTIDPIDHFKNKPPVVKEIYDKLITTVNKIGPVTINAVKSAIFLKTKSTYIEIKPKKKYVVIAFYLDKEVNESPISRVVQLGKNRFAHLIHLQNPTDINKQVIDWLKESYKLINSDRQK